MNRIEQQMQNLQRRGEKAMITYITAGLPDLETTKKLLKAQAQAGVDVVELGIPFSDPIADGPVIQDASFRSIQNGTNVENVFGMVDGLRQTCEVPIVFMMYYNTALHYGLEAFVDQCVRTGVDGLIIPDLPLEEQGELRAILDQKDGAPILIQLVSPVSKERIPMILKQARGFVYCVSSMGVTGQKADFHKNIMAYLREVKAASDIPIMLGFGIRRAADVGPMRELVDGAIIGSYFIQLMEESGFDEQTAKEYISTFKRELNAFAYEPELERKSTSDLEQFIEEQGIQLRY
ncbi:MAG: tryptophan synthase subunit alpha [Lachnospiraceae bacterium]